MHHWVTSIRMNSAVLFKHRGVQRTKAILALTGQQIAAPPHSNSEPAVPESVVLNIPLQKHTLLSVFYQQTHRRWLTVNWKAEKAECTYITAVSKTQFQESESGRIHKLKSERSMQQKQRRSWMHHFRSWKQALNLSPHLFLWGRFTLFPEMNGRQTRPALTRRVARTPAKHSSLIDLLGCTFIAFFKLKPPPVAPAGTTSRFSDWTLSTGDWCSRL